MATTFYIPRQTDLEIVAALSRVRASGGWNPALKISVHLDHQGWVQLPDDHPEAFEQIQFALKLNSTVFSHFAIKNPHRNALSINRDLAKPWDTVNVTDDWINDIPDAQTRARHYAELVASARAELKAHDLDASLKGAGEDAWNRYRDAQMAVVNSLQQASETLLIKTADKNAELDRALQGAGNGSVNGNITDGGGALSVSLVGPGTWTLNGVNTYSGGTTNLGGTLLVNGSLASGNVIAISGTLGGGGVIGGAVTMQSGSTLSPGNSIGKLTINNDLTLAGMTLLEINKSAMTNDQLVVAGTLTFGGTLVVTNLAGTFAVGDSFYLFNAALTGGAFADFNLPPLGAGLAWDTSNLAGGVISVVATVGPEFTVMSRTGDGNFHFTGTGAAGITYELDATTNLIPPIAWEFVTNAIADQSGYFELRDLSATNFPQRFYRIMSAP